MDTQPPFLRRRTSRHNLQAGECVGQSAVMPRIVLLWGFASSAASQTLPTHADETRAPGGGVEINRLEGL